MDHRHTEDFARRMEMAELRGRYLRDRAIDDMFARLARRIRSAAHALWCRLVDGCRNLLPEA